MKADTWKLVASGKNAGSVQIISFPAEETSKFKIVQTGTKGNYWSIHELYAACSRCPSTGILPDASSSAAEMFYYNGQLSWSGLGNDMSTRIEIVDLSGRRCFCKIPTLIFWNYQVMQKGFYIVIATNGTNVLRKKLFFKD